MLYDKNMTFYITIFTSYASVQVQYFIKLVSERVSLNFMLVNMNDYCYYLPASLF